MSVPIDPRPSSQEPSSSLLAGIRILVVDDDDDAREILKHVLVHAGATVSTAASAEQALIAVAGVDIVVTDFSMPVQSGGWLLERIRERPRPVPVIAFTGYGDVFAAELAKVGFARVLRKPLDPWQMCQEIRATLRDSR